MLALFEIAEIGQIRAFLISIPESVGILVFGIALVTTAVLFRRLIGHGSGRKDESINKG